MTREEEIGYRKRSSDRFLKPGTPVTYAFPQNGTSWDQRTAAKYLVLGANYTVESNLQFRSATHLYLREFAGVIFNNVNFTFLDGTPAG